MYTDCKYMYLYIHQSADVTRVRVPLYRGPLEGITFQDVHHEKGRRELWWDLLYSHIGLFFMKSPKSAFGKARSRNCQVWKHVLPRLLINLTVVFLSWETSQNFIPSTSVQSAISIISCCGWKCQYQVGVSNLCKFQILHVHISYLWVTHNACVHIISHYTLILYCLSCIQV